MKRIAIVILNWNGKEHLQTFLPSVLQHSSDVADIMVADNGSSDGSVAMLNEQFPTVQIIQLDKNHGFTGGYNRAIAQIEHEFSVLLNSDVEVSEHWIEPLLNLFDSDTAIAAIQPKILSFENKSEFEYAGAGGGYIDFLAYPFCRGRLFENMEADQGQYDDTREIFWATGACMFIRTKVFKEVGGFDEDFFAHNEEIDLCWRLKNRDLKVYYCGQSKVFHLGGGTLHKSNPHKTFLNFRNNLTMLIKNDRSGFLFSKFIMRLVLDGIAGLVFFLKGNGKDTLAVVQAHFAVYKKLADILEKRKKLGNKRKHMKEIYLHSIVFESFVQGKKKIEMP
jgi:GT2 family glycosyltransferase